MALTPTCPIRLPTRMGCTSSIPRGVLCNYKAMLATSCSCCYICCNWWWQCCCRSADGADGADAADDDAADTHDSVEHCSPQSVAMATSAIATAHTDDGVRQAAAESNPCQPASTQSWHVPWCAPPSPTAAVDATATAAATAVSTA